MAVDMDVNVCLAATKSNANPYDPNEVLYFNVSIFVMGAERKRWMQEQQVRQMKDVMTPLS
jgi:hypothetical protein